MRHFFAFFGAFLGGLCLCSQAHAGAWVQPKGEGLALLQATYYSTDQFFDESGTHQSQNRFRKAELQPYLEYGLTQKLTLGTSFSLQSNFQSGNNKVGVGDPEIFARHVLWSDAVQVFSIQPLFKFASLYRDSDSLPRGGSSSNDYELSLLYGRNLKLISDHDYVDLRAGYRHRGGALNDQWRADAALALAISEQWQIIPAIRGTLSTNIPDAATFSQNGDLDYDLLRVELGTRFAISATRAMHLTAFHHLDGRQTGGGFGVTTGLAQSF